MESIQFFLDAGKRILVQCIYLFFPLGRGCLFFVEAIVLLHQFIKPFLGGAKQWRLGKADKKGVSMASLIRKIKGKRLFIGVEAKRIPAGSRCFFAKHIKQFFLLLNQHIVLKPSLFSRVDAVCNEIDVNTSTLGT